MTINRDAAQAADWRCFHCDDVFTERHTAAAHFGATEHGLAACQIKAGSEGSMVTALRDAEQAAADAQSAIHAESTDAAKAYYAQADRHREQLRVVEEHAYERGLAEGRDAQAAPLCLWCRHPSELAGAVSRADSAEMERDRLAAENAQLGAERDAALAAVTQVTDRLIRANENSDALLDAGVPCIGTLRAVIAERDDYIARERQRVTERDAALARADLAQREFRGEALRWRWAAKELRSLAHATASDIRPWLLLADRIERGSQKEGE